jgi:metallo-beta-lactamase family protein
VEELLYWIDRLENERRMPEIPVYVDSPMAAAVLQSYRQRMSELDPEIRTQAIANNGGRAVAERRLLAFTTANLRVVTAIKDSRDLQESAATSIVISSSGMATGGRVLHHLSRALPNPRNTVLFAGFQSPGTRGRALVDGASFVKIHGREIPVEARVENLESMSAHADAGEIVRWLRGFKAPPALTCLVHGEPDAMDTLKARIERELGWSVRAPNPSERMML